MNLDIIALCVEESQLRSMKLISRKYITQTNYINLEVKCENCGLDYCFDEELVSTCENGFHCPNCGEIVKEHENEED